MTKCLLILMTIVAIAQAKVILHTQSFPKEQFSDVYAGVGIRLKSNGAINCATWVDLVMGLVKNAQWPVGKSYVYDKMIFM